MNARRSRIIHLCSVAVAALAFALSALPRLTVDARTHPAGSGLHLYASEPALHRVLRFPLDSAGRPAGQPDAIIDGLSEPRGLAIGPDRRLYVIDAAARALAVYEPSPATGARPSYVLPLPKFSGEGAIGVDAAGFIYISYSVGCSGYSCGHVNVYRPITSGNDHPIARYFLGATEPIRLVTALVVNDARDLATLSAGSPAIYADAPKQSQQVPYPLFCPSISGWGAAWGPGRELIVSAIGSFHHAGAPSQIVVIPDYAKGSIPNCPASYAITSSTVPLNDPYGLAYNGGLVYATSIYSQTVKSALIFVFDPTVAGAQKPLAIVGGPASLLRAPYALAVGP